MRRCVRDLLLGIAAGSCLAGVGGWWIGGEAAAAEPARTPFEEITPFAYVEASYVWNLGHTGRRDVNELRVYDFDAGFSFNMAELSVKKEPSERWPFGVGLVLTAGLDAQKNHAIGIFRDGDDAFPFRNTAPYDLQEAYASYRVPLGAGLVLKAGKFVSLLGYETIESPNNLNVSRSFLFGVSSPLAHVGVLASSPLADWLTVTAGPIVGWDVADDNNDKLSWTAQVALTPWKDLAISLGLLIGPEQPGNGEVRSLWDLVVAWTGMEGLTLAFNAEYGREDDDAVLVAAAARRDGDVSWWGWAAYAAWDWTERLRTAVRLEYFQDSDGVRTLAVAAGSKVSLWAVTATAQYRLWRGLHGRLEYRHDRADEKVFKARAPGLVPTARTQDTLAVSVYYLFF